MIETTDLQILSNINMIDPKLAAFTKVTGGYLTFNYNNIEYKKVKLSRALPYKAPDNYICITDKDGKEIGIIKNIVDFDKEQVELINNELGRLYYSPVITRIVSAKDKMGYLFFDVMTTAGKREFALRDASRNIKYVDPENKTAVQILDVDGNRYLIENFDKLDQASCKKIEAFLV
ncbi:MAG: hypothetical protein K0S55_1069 [Clostridia bacterium]|nr:hypothetical protein [Clostridia bacterium]